MEGPLSNIELEKVEAVMKQMKNGKATGATCVVIKMLKARDERCLKLLIKTFKEKLFENKLPSDWKLRSLIPIFDTKAFDRVPQKKTWYALRKKRLKVPRLWYSVNIL